MSFPFQLISFHVIHVERFPKSKNYDFSLGKPFIEEVFKSGLKSGEQGGTLENSRLATEKDLAQSHKLHPYHVKYGDGARKRPCVFDDVSTVLFAGFAKKPKRFAIHSCGNVNVMTWIPCKGYRPKSIISTFAAFLLHFSKIASAKLRCVTLPHRSPKLLYKLCLQSRRHIHA